MASFDIQVALVLFCSSVPEKVDINKKCFYKK